MKRSNSSEKAKNKSSVRKNRRTSKGELQEIDRELQKNDSQKERQSRYRYQPNTTEVKANGFENSTAMVNIPGISDMLMVKFAL